MDIDLNADLGEGAGFDAELMPLVTSANVCCGLHAGGPGEIAKTLGLAHKHGVAIGAHPGYADREQFGRREMELGNQELVALCVYQLGALGAMAAALGWRCGTSSRTERCTTRRAATAAPPTCS